MKQKAVNELNQGNFKKSIIKLDNLHGNETHFLTGP